MPTQAATLAQDGAPFLVGEWLVEPSLNRLSRDGVSVQLELKAMDVLLCLVEFAGEVVSKHDLLDAVWQTEFISDNSLQRRIADLRDALGDDAQKPRHIETIRKRGYRLIAEVGAMTPLGEPAAPMPEPPAGEHSPQPKAEGRPEAGGWAEDTAGGVAQRVGGWSEGNPYPGPTFRSQKPM